MTKTIAINLLLLFAATWALADGCPKEPPLPRILHQALYEAHQFLDKGESGKAAQRLKEFSENRPDLCHHQLDFMRGMLAYQAKDLTGAEKHISQAVKRHPCFGLAWRNLVVVQYEMKKPQKAAASSLKAYDLITPSDPELIYQASVFLLEAGKPGKALTHLKKLAARKTVKPTWLKALVRAYLDLKKWEPASLAARRLLKLEPQDAALWRMAAGVELRRKRLRQAAADLEVAFRLKAPDKHACRQLGEIYRAAGLPARAVPWLQKAYAPNPSPAQWETLARVHRQAGSWRKALTAINSSLIKPTPKRMALLAEIQVMLRDFRAAARAYARAAELGKNPGNWITAAQCAWQSGELNEARRYLKAALASCKDDPSKGKQARNLLNELDNYIKYQMESSQGEPQ